MNRTFYENLNKKNPATGQKHSHGIQAKDHAQFISDSNDLAYSFGKYTRDNKSLTEAIEWILGFDMYSKDTTGTYTGRYSSARRLGRGKIVNIDAFGNIGTEQKKNRPAVILQEDSDGVVIAPIVSSAYSSGKDYHVPLRRKVADEGNMTSNCGIKLNQIRYVDKSRVTFLAGKIKDVGKLNEIDDKLVNYLAPMYHKAHEDLKQENSTLKGRVTSLEAQNEAFKEEVEKKDEIIELLERKKQELMDKLAEIELSVTKNEK